MWVARDKDNMLYLYESKPVRGKEAWDTSTETEYCDSNYMDIKSDLFPNLKWENEPIEVELIDKRIADQFRISTNILNKMTNSSGSFEQLRPKPNFTPIDIFDLL